MRRERRRCNSNKFPGDANASRTTGSLEEAGAWGGGGTKFTSFTVFLQQQSWDGGGCPLHGNRANSPRRLRQKGSMATRGLRVCFRPAFSMASLWKQTPVFWGNWGWRCVCMCIVFIVSNYEIFHKYFKHTENDATDTHQCIYHFALTDVSEYQCPNFSKQPLILEQFEIYRNITDSTVIYSHTQFSLLRTSHISIVYLSQLWTKLISN